VGCVVAFEFVVGFRHLVEERCPVLRVVAVATGLVRKVVRRAVNVVLVREVQSRYLDTDGLEEGADAVVPRVP